MRSRIRDGLFAFRSRADTRRLRIRGLLPPRFIGFRANPVILRAAPAPLAWPAALTFYQDNLVDFGQTGTFVRVSGGYALRLRGAGDQVRTELKVGQSFGDRVLVFVEGRLVVTAQRGRSIGV